MKQKKNNHFNFCGVIVSILDIIEINLILFLCPNLQQEQS